MEGEICKNSIFGLWKLNSRIIKRHNKKPQDSSPT
jgi:hypothetical protein